MGIGRPSLYSEELSESIVEAMFEGKSLRAICRELGIGASTVIGWQAAHPEFANRCAHARELQADYFADLIQERAESVTEDDAQAAKTAISAYQWLAAKRAPKRYGDAINLKHSDTDGRPIIPIINVTIGGKKETE